ncbi:TonB-dependent receptor [Aquimarina sp. TRL1]|uniref:TonB-dependent receptor n=1 Tax=Aquimarina sp. (strain TRL1) TaxID=2736252 RepID=UPI00158D5B1D|nr:TonB-dependent receptor [Aquimarina sp. TRL1]QKX07110.1 TonB-dependent receptor [Aquimarina sp. TRL1]
MKSLLIALLTVFLSSFSYAQTTISGTVTDPKGMPIIGANIYIDGTYDGSSSNDQGAFSFTTSETGSQTLVVSFISFETYFLFEEVTTMNNLHIKLKEDVNSLDSVILTAGTFAAGDNSKASVLSPMDIVTTAGAAGDYIAAFQTLPGTSTVAEDGRLFVRGGDANEANVYIDGLRVFQPFTARTNNIPTRGRFSPFLFSGTNFSTGGYSAEYGDALSSVLLMNTIDQPDQEKTDIQIINVGVGAGNTQKWNDNNSLSFNAFYLNLKPYQEIISQDFDWKKPYESLAGEAVYRHQFTNGLLKVYGGVNYTRFRLIQEDINIPSGIDFSMKNRNLYLNTSYKGSLGNDWSITSGLSFANDHNDIRVQDTDIANDDYTAHLKLSLRKRFSNRVKLHIGAEQFLNSHEELTAVPNIGNFDTHHQNNSTATFAETNIFFSKKLAMQVGVRGTYNNLLDTYRITPRASLAYKISSNAQLSLAYGDFYQTPQHEVLKYTMDIEPEKSSHYILNYLYQKEGRTLRAEAYYKQYDNLLTYDTEMPTYNSLYTNNGNGYAQGIDLYWRDNSSIKNFEYWLSYSYLDTERTYKNYPTAATPNFAATHNISLVGKLWVDKWKSMIGATYNFASGRPYTDPNTNSFLSEKTKAYNSLNMNWAYLISQQKILYVSVSNILGTKNIFNYQYADTPTPQGTFPRRAITPSADRFFIVGFFWTISDRKNDNQLDNL